MTTSEWVRSKIGPAPHPVLPERARRVEEGPADFFTGFLRPEMRVLHAYCAGGKATLSLAAHVSMGDVTGIDPDVTNLRRARSRSTTPDGGNVTFERCSLPDLPFGPGSFDAALVDGALSVESSPEKALEEVRRVLAPGGLLGVRHTVESSRVVTEASPLIERALRRRDTVLRDVGGDPDAGLRQPSLLRAAGFVNLQVTSSTEQKSDYQLLAELDAGGFVPGYPETGPGPEEDESPVMFTFVTAVETVCWKLV